MVRVELILDSWALLALLDDEPCASAVQAVLDDRTAAVSVINLGEVASHLVRRFGDERRALEITERLTQTVHAVPADWPSVRRAALIKARGGLSYAEAFCVAAAQGLSVPLWTGDPEIIAMQGTVDVVDLRSAV